MVGERMVNVIAEGVTVSFGSRTALRNVSIVASSGDVIVVRGKSGSGKSTLLRVFAGVQRYSGLLQIACADIGGQMRVPRVGWVPQEPSLWHHLTAMENIALVGRSVAGMSAKDARRAAEALTEQLSLAGRGSQYPISLSGGEARRFAFARALIARPDVLLLDEISGGLDPASKDSTFAVLNGARAAGAVVLLASHEYDDLRAPFPFREHILVAPEET